MRNAQVTWRFLRKAPLMLKHVPLCGTWVLTELMRLFCSWMRWKVFLTGSTSLQISMGCLAQKCEHNQQAHRPQNSQVHHWKNTGHLFNNNTVSRSSI